ncbi:zf-TFIIB domain-containing protein [Pseudoxanthomonas daejeonensis]|uniref:TFIIB-type zinc ribbon-containing protein n=1 Tax=Pseudoxanthomonas daejeonensis TaxID=266062 RepID=UPI001F544B97|nr:zf-TFIIB domain-containing protein [Pseudoxanthomonas daejeonensis]UNK58531.1 zf-TFIIB domain-containing protein [Pseudoxanthomonas daejeonensis]
MHCPACKTVTLAMTERQGIEIDYCPECRGVWLDRGELDRLLARAETDAPPPPPRPAYRNDDRPRHDRHDAYAHGHKPRKPKSLLGELFDF